MTTPQSPTSKGSILNQLIHGDMNLPQAGAAILKWDAQQLAKVEAFLGNGTPLANAAKAVVTSAEAFVENAINLVGEDVTSEVATLPDELDALLQKYIGATAAAALTAATKASAE